ncbi:hypothetical protein CC80DRAFT_480593 [Byssothecium circinans]|uniref:Inner kinetochore subunit AME1 domain-containing protein n=1 Tax=Byssothecium circinans TaxID=147558 RepID=A0A6A5TS15_9PLEO|nr:hypothetical protein CC80DRAFT_480593 [Byssothecium circinans]
MAPGDRHERRQQRVRGAGASASSVQTNFGFNLAALAPKAKQASAPPRSRRTPTPSQKTPRAVNGSAKRHRSASVHRSSSSAKRHATPKGHAVTPQTGKRKRGSKHAQSAEGEGEDGGDGDGEVDDLSPDHDKAARSIEKSRRVAGTVSPIREEADEVPDELSFLDDGAGSVQKAKADTSIVSGGTPIAPEKTPIADRIGNMSVSSHMAMRRSKSFEPPITPSMLPNGRPRLSSASHFGPAFTTPGVQQEGEDSEDELTPQIHDATPRVVAIVQSTAPATQEAPEEDGQVDELSSPAQPVLQTPLPKQQAKPKPQPSKKPTEEQQPAPAKRGRPKRVTTNKVEARPGKNELRRKKKIPEVQEEVEEVDAPDEISPEATRTKPPPVKKVHRSKERKKQPKESIEISSAEESDNYEPEEEQHEYELPARLAPKKQQTTKPTSDEPPRKRRKFGGPKQAISVMRIKGSTVRGVTVADTTRTILEQNIDHHVSRMAEKMQTSQDAARRKQIRVEINLALAFKESLNEKLMDLQDANDTLSTGFKKRKEFKASNIERRKEILAIQNSRQEVALEMDDEQAMFDAEKAKVDARNQLHANLFGIQTAIQNGRERARRQGREDEGPDIPLSMLLENVGRDVGSIGGGLLASVKKFNTVLEGAAGWLEGRA